uniref:Regulator of G-protein signaling 14-like n=1 Tax=Sinocyclocheilus anshuiensis TaxID=1608454 RepID=A0A671K6L2_9TELE
PLFYHYDRVRVEEKDVQNPHPDIFQKAQQQIFKLMKFDSYTRFVRSQLYQSCMLANVEGRPLPGLDPRGRPLTTTKHTSSTSPKEQVKFDRTKERKEKRGSWGEAFRRSNEFSVLCWPFPESPISFKTGLVKSSEVTCCKVEKLVARSADGRVDKYCCVFLPDGTASLTPARPGVTIRNMLTSLCEKRGLPLSDIIIYLHGKDKLRPLNIKWDHNLLCAHVFVLWFLHRVQVAFTGKTVAIVVKSNKTLQDALTAMLQKYHLRSQDATVTMSGTGQIISMNTAVTSLANKKLILDKGITQPPYLNVLGLSGLVELLNRAQCCSADDQRGLLKKEHLMLPQFLQLPLEEVEESDTIRSLEESCSSMGSLEVDSPAIQSNTLGKEQSENECSNPARETVV